MTSRLSFSPPMATHPNERVLELVLFLLMLCNVAAELETEIVPIVLQLAKSEMSDEFRSEAAGVSVVFIIT